MKKNIKYNFVKVKCEKCGKSRMVQRRLMLPRLCKDCSIEQVKTGGLRSF